MSPDRLELDAATRPRPLVPGRAERASAGRGPSELSHRRPSGERQLARHDGGGKLVAPSQVAVDAGGGRAALGYRPDDQALAPCHVAAGEHARDASLRKTRVDSDIAPGVEPEPELGHAAVDLRAR